MGLIDDLIRKVDLNLRVTKVVVGVRYTAVQLENGNVGLSYTEEAGGLSAILPGSLTCRRAKELAILLRSPKGIESSIGLACINAIINQNAKGEEVDAMELVEIRPGDVVAMVGFFPGYAEMLKNMGAKVKVLEIREMGGGDVRS